MPDVLGGLLARRGQSYAGQPLAQAVAGARSRLPSLEDVLLAPARGMTAQPPAALSGLLGTIHGAIDPVQAFGGYGNMAAMVLPPGKPAGLLATKLKPRIESEGQNEWIAHFNDDAKMWFSKSQDGIHVTDITAPKSQPVRGRQMLEWLQNKFGEPVTAHEINPPTKGFWDKMQQEGLVAGLTDEPYSTTATTKRGGLLDAENAAISRTRPNRPPEPTKVTGPKGAAPDRTEYSLVRHEAKQGDSARFKALEAKLDTHPTAANKLKAIAAEGEDIGRKWYDTEELRTRFQDVLGPDKGDAAWREYMQLVGATSTGSKVLPNIKNASHYFVQGRQKLLSIADDLMAGNVTPPEGYGHKLQINQARNVGRIMTGEFGREGDPLVAPKPRGFAQSLLGSTRNIAADKHFMRLMGMVSDDPAFLHGSGEVSQAFVKKLQSKYGNTLDQYIKTNPIKDAKGRPTDKQRITFNAKKAVREGPADLFKTIKGDASVWDDQPGVNEYKAFERITGKLARDMDMTPAQFQASLWMGAAKKTKVDPSSLDTFVNLFNRKVADAAVERGRTPADVFRRFATRKEALALPLGLLGGGLLAGDQSAKP